MTNQGLGQLVLEGRDEPGFRSAVVTGCNGLLTTA